MAKKIKDCRHDEVYKIGRDRKGAQRWRCKACGKTTNKEIVRPLGDMRISLTQASQALALITEGVSIRGTRRLTGMTTKTLCSLVLNMGQLCDRFLYLKVRNIEAPELEMDETWSFVYCRGKTAREKGCEPGQGNVWTWFAIDSKTKLIVAHEVGSRDKKTGNKFLKKLQVATVGETRVTTDGLSLYATQIIKGLGSRAVHASVAKANYTERFNLTLRSHVRRCVRSTNAHSKCPHHHAAMIALFTAWYNFCRFNTGSGKQTTPAMAAGLTEHRWTIAELLQEAANANHEATKKSQQEVVLPRLQVLRASEVSVPTVRRSGSESEIAGAKVGVGQIA